MNISKFFFVLRELTTHSRQFIFGTGYVHDPSYPARFDEDTKIQNDSILECFKTNE